MNSNSSSFGAKKGFEGTKPTPFPERLLNEAIPGEVPTFAAAPRSRTAKESRHNTTASFP
jgi:hypothetical protein